jgi:cytoskeletal protein RodZ
VAGAELVLRLAGRVVRWSSDARWFAAGLVAPLIVWGTVLVAAAQTVGVGWNVHMVSGLLTLVAITGGLTALIARRVQPAPAQAAYVTGSPAQASAGPPVASSAESPAGSPATETAGSPATVAAQPTTGSPATVPAQPTTGSPATVPAQPTTGSAPAESPAGSAGDAGIAAPARKAAGGETTAATGAPVDDESRTGVPAS